MINIIEYIQLQTTLNDEQAQQCFGYSKTLRVSAYCFKCNGFLCKACHRFHVTSKITEDHRPNTVAVEDVASKRVSFDKLASLKEAPRCYTHSEKVSELCCKTCSNMPICVACTYGNHKSQDIYEVTALANENRQKLEQKLAEVYTFEGGILQMSDKLDKIKSDLNAAVSDKLKSTQMHYSRMEKRTREKLQF
ncbi:hypothetical protein HOLleu_17163 [Holothuria leucospilota]|uniref:B box-type domain-containing protein n=1 Tax=Holothuria leucospilota TaxID=206669 RepID=A0A9Q1C6U7_HOLLE|nr:hypothetical protein HOLleu_17163 [Holothuria leucospilota]